MVINSIYRKYFQKSKIFLYPLLDIKRGTNIVPEETYLSWNDEYVPEDIKLICKYDIKGDKDYSKFESSVLLKHNRLLDYIKVSDEEAIFIFDFSDFSNDWNYFINGKYSQMNISTKNKILDFFDKKSGNYAYVNSYLFPEKYYTTYAELLNCSEELLISVGELCSKPDFEKEKLLIKVANLENIKILD
jgi:hypothetical protein